jgi:LacI family transcriptional regulator
VSSKTVSRVLNDEPHVRPDIRQRVRDVAARLAYRPNINARGLITRRSYMIGLTYERPSASYVVELQRGALERLAGTPYRLLVLPFDDATHRIDGLFDLIAGTPLDGMLLAPPAADLMPLLDRLDGMAMPYARIGPHRALDRGAVVTLDDRAAARELAEHMLSLGHRRFAIITGNPDHAACSARLAGYADAFAAAGIDIAGVPAASGDFTFEGGEVAAMRLLSAPERPTAILAQNDEMAAAVTVVARRMGLELPRDLSVGGFDDAEIAALTWPPLTTIRQPIDAMATAAADALLRAIEGGEHAPPQSFGHAMRCGGSTAPPPAMA